MCVQQIAAKRRRQGCATVAAAIVTCLRDGHDPTESEIEAVAARIWTDVRDRTEPAGLGLRMGSPEYRRMMIFARAALGVRVQSRVRTFRAARDAVSELSFTGIGP